MLTGILFRRIVREGTLTVVDANGKSETFGSGRSDEPHATVRITDRATEAKIAAHPKLYLGEAYMDGRLVVEEGTLYDFLDICGRNVLRLEQHPLWGVFERAGALFRPLLYYNPVGRARKNAFPFLRPRTPARLPRLPCGARGTPPRTTSGFRCPGPILGASFAPHLP